MVAYGRLSVKGRISINTEFWFGYWGATHYAETWQKELVGDGLRWSEYFVHVDFEVPRKGKYLANLGDLGLTLRRRLGKGLRQKSFVYDKGSHRHEYILSFK